MWIGDYVKMMRAIGPTELWDALPIAAGAGAWAGEAASAPHTRRRPFALGDLASSLRASPFRKRQAYDRGARRPKSSMAKDAKRREARDRRAARASWPVRKFRLGEEPVDDFSACTVAERLAMTWRMTCDAWASAGRPLPSYTRQDMPVRVLRRAAADQEEQDAGEK